MGTHVLIHTTSGPGCLRAESWLFLDFHRPLPQSFCWCSWISWRFQRANQRGSCRNHTLSLPFSTVFGLSHLCRLLATSLAPLPVFCLPPPSSLLSPHGVGPDWSDLAAAAAPCSGSFSDSSVGKESTCNAGDSGSIPGLGRSPREGIIYPLQYSWASLVTQLVKNLLQCGRPGFDPWVGKMPWRRERLPTRVFWPGELAKSWTRLSDFHFHFLPVQEQSQ